MLGVELGGEDDQSAEGVDAVVEQDKPIDARAAGEQRVEAAGKWVAARWDKAKTAVSGGLGWLARKMGGGLREAAVHIAAAPEYGKQVVSELGETVVDTARVTGEGLSELGGMAVEGYNQAAGAVRQGRENVSSFVTTAGETYKGLARDAAEVVGEKADAAADAIDKGYKYVKEGTRAAALEIGDTISESWHAVEDTYQEVAAWGGRQRKTVTEAARSRRDKIVTGFRNEMARREAVKLENARLAKIEDARQQAEALSQQEVSLADQFAQVQAEIQRVQAQKEGYKLLLQQLQTRTA